MSGREGKFTTISVTVELRDELRRMKRGGESYSDLLRAVTAEYDPDEKKQ